jgi:NAD-dependent deacetylase
MAALQALKPGTTHITQNVDGLLDRAGCRGVLELHGRLMRSRCDACMRGFGEDAPASTRCPDCGGLVRPDIVMFGEELPHVVHADAELASKRCEVFVLVGTSAVVHPAAGLPMRALARGAKLLVINQEPTPLDAEADAVLRGRAEELLPALVEALS